MLPPDPTNEDFTLEYRSDQRLLIGRWLRPMSLPELQATYESLLTAARANDNCRHWLLDVRRRGMGDEIAREWFGREFSPRLLLTLNGPAFVAYFGTITHEVATTMAVLGTNIEQGAQTGAHYRYFNREDEALAWLNKQP